MNNWRCNLVHHRFEKLHRNMNIVVTAKAIVLKVQNNLLGFFVGAIVDGFWASS